MNSLIDARNQKSKWKFFCTLFWMPKTPDVSIYRSPLTWIRNASLASFRRSDVHSYTISTHRNHAKRAPGSVFQPRVFGLGFDLYPIYIGTVLNSHVLQNLYQLRATIACSERHSHFRKPKLAHACAIFAIFLKLIPHRAKHSPVSFRLYQCSWLRGLLQVRYEKPRGGSRGAMTRSLSGR
jgi:hypothetical protein